MKFAKTASILIYICIRSHDTGRSLEPIFMKFTWLVRVSSIDLVVNRQRFGLLYMFRHLIRVKIAWVQTNRDDVAAN